jgi:hypothetical protein
MLYYALVFLIVGLITGALGIYGVNVKSQDACSPFELAGIIGVWRF